MKTTNVKYNQLDIKFHILNKAFKFLRELFANSSAHLLKKIGYSYSREEIVLRR